jgi:hypothetical protein
MPRPLKGGRWNLSRSGICLREQIVGQTSQQQKLPFALWTRGEVAFKIVKRAPVV